MGLGSEVDFRFNLRGLLDPYARGHGALKIFIEVSGLGGSGSRKISDIVKMLLDMSCEN